MNRTVLTAGLLAVIVAASGYIWLDRFGSEAEPARRRPGPGRRRRPMLKTRAASK